MAERTVKTMDEILKNLQLPTSQLQLEHFQATLNFVQKTKRVSTAKNHDLQHFIHAATDLLWIHLMDVLPTTECQLMCAATFFTLLSVYEDVTNHLQNAENTISTYHSTKTHDREHSKKDTLITISLIYGLYQSPFISLATESSMIRRILETSFEVLFLSAYEYSEFTYVTFKTLQNLKKLLESNFKGMLFENQRRMTLLKVTSHNWENPITGVRDLNKTVFGLFLDVSKYMNETENYQKIINEINTYPWNKSKYLMLSEIIVRESKNAAVLFEKYSDWLSGLINSLTTSSLVSAGADMYFAVLKKTNSDTEWSKIFLDTVINILKGPDYKTIENFNNYWCMNTLKQFPKVLDILAAKLKSSQKENTIYAHMSVLRQGNKLGQLSKPWPGSYVNIDQVLTDNSCAPFLKNIVAGLEHINVNIRIQTFEIICIAHNNALPVKVEFDLILKFMHENVNSDSTILRLSMLNNIKLFFARLHISTMNAVKHMTSSSHGKYDLLQNCSLFQSFLMSQMKMHGNYQRSVTTAKLCDIFLLSFSKPLRKKRSTYTKITNHFTLKQWLIEENMWFLECEDFINSLMKFLDDPAEDVRETISEILLLHYSDHFTSSRVQDLLEKCMKNIQSKYFYDVRSGHCGMKLLSNLLLNSEFENCMFSTIEDLFQNFFNNFICEMNSTNDILMSIETGHPLHSLICILQNILEVCLQRSYSLNNLLTNERKTVLVNKLDLIPKLYTLEEGIISSPDLSEMSDMVEQLISKSACKLPVEDGDVKISDLHQIVINCIWLNLKACCDMLCVLVRCMDQDKDLRHADMCLHIIANVLETSRHKGAIESAGVALGKSVRHLSSLPSNLEISRVPMKLLKRRLEDLIYENKMGSITRRGAGLSIMLHRIVSNDMVKGKPLFHYAINMLLEASITSDPEEKLANCNERDIPKAIYIHLMTKIVADSSLSSDVMHYSASLAEVALANLRSEQWQIRNAALQLYGALVPKLIGQKKSATNEEESAATVGCDELRTHSRKLWIHIQGQLESQGENDDIVQAHSNLVPILNILASTAKRYNFTIDYDDIVTSDNNMFKNLMRLLSSPIHNVRRLTAKSIELMYSFEIISSYILETKALSENLLHGFLILIKFCKIRLSDNLGYEDTFVSLEHYFGNVMKNRKYSYVVKSVYDEIFLQPDKDCIQLLGTTINTLNRHQSVPGAFLWANIVIEKCVAIGTDIPAITKCLIDLSDFETYCNLILKRLQSDKSITGEDMKQIVSVLVESDRMYEHGGIWKILYEISKKDKIYFDDLLLSATAYLETNNYKVPHKIRYFIPFVANAFVLSRSDHPYILKFSSLVYSLTDYETVDIDMRFIAAIANNSLGLVIKSLPQDVRINVVKSALNLLQDDDEGVRFEAAKFYSNATIERFLHQPYICFKNILHPKFLLNILGPSKTYLINFIDNFLLTLNINKHKEEKSYNPFVIETRNIYVEAHIFANDLYLLKLTLQQSE